MQPPLPETEKTTDERIAQENKAVYSHTNPEEQRSIIASLRSARSAAVFTNKFFLAAAVIAVVVGGGTTMALVTRKTNIATPYLPQKTIDKLFTQTPTKDKGQTAQNGASGVPGASKNNSTVAPSAGTTAPGAAGQTKSPTTQPRSGSASPGSSSPKPGTRAPSKPAPTTDSAYLAGWGLPAWRDEFSSATVDTSKWNVRSRTDLGLLDDSAIPTPSQISQSGGILHMRGDWLATPQTRPTSKSGVTLLTHSTGYMDHRALKPGNYSYKQQYGRWEMRAQTPTGPNTLGSQPAFWLRNDSKGEIDIMEAWGYAGNTPSDSGYQTYLKNTAKTTFFGDTSTTSSLLEQVRWRERGSSIVPWDGFHTYALEYLPTRAAVIVDGKTIWSATPATKPALWGASYQSPWHVRVNLHIGYSQQYWGLPNPNNRSLTQPLDYKIDYIRIYKP